jgi:hypothetical protein
VRDALGRKPLLAGFWLCAQSLLLVRIRAGFATSPELNVQYREDSEIAYILAHRCQWRVNAAGSGGASIANLKCRYAEIVCPQVFESALLAITDNPLSGSWASREATLRAQDYALICDEMNSGLPGSLSRAVSGVFHDGVRLRHADKRFDLCNPLAKAALDLRYCVRFDQMAGLIEMLKVASQLLQEFMGKA